ncbi:hypothetical protein ACRALDRAFT_1072332 [Sodiomyces alcalophilus JCM 7366]|uniref:uncharacterized protein n=1 Tax=Sodiomyces alcalophilus JCM 7366 TaxID=591952 RepID=UPI0039B53ED0
MAEPKINSKNLSYTSTLPPFLRALHAQASGDAASGPDPILAARRRAAKKRSDSEEAEDQPLVVDKSGNVVRVGVDAEGRLQEEPAHRGEDPADKNIEADEARREREREKEREKIANIGPGRKRKVGRVIGGGDDDDGEQAEGVRSGKRTTEEEAEGSSRSKKGEVGGEQKDAKHAKNGQGNPPKAKKKAKKIKLSFDPE